MGDYHSVPNPIAYKLAWTTDGFNETRYNANNDCIVFC